GSAEMRAAALDACQVAAWNGQDFAQALDLTQKQFELLDELRDPEKIAELYEGAVAPYALVGRFHEARQIAAKFDEATQPLSPHHRLHGVAVIAELEELIGDWNHLRELREEAEERVALNLQTPCVRNMRTLLVCS